MVIHVIIPTYQEAGTIRACLEMLNFQTGNFQVVIIDGGSTDGTLDQVQAAQVRYPLRWETAPRKGRSAQMNWGARTVQNGILLFLHSDTQLSPGALAQLEQLEPEVIGGRFDVQLDNPAWPYRIIGHLINWRTRWAKRFTGDMGIFVRQEIFVGLGGFPDQPLMEDLEFSRLLWRYARASGKRLAYLDLPVTTSARRWQKNGILQTFLIMQTLRTAYALGVSPHRLAQVYRLVR